MATAAEEQGRAAAREEAPDGARDEAAAGAEETVKIICLGDSAVGKSKLLERFLLDGFQPQQLSTFALTLYQHRARVGGQEVRVDFWDTAGQERFRSMHASYYHQAHACIMVFDVQRKVTYKNLNSWYKELREFRPEIPCIVVANKIDGECVFCCQLARVVVGFTPVLTENQCPLSVGSRGFPQSPRAGSYTDLSCCFTGACPVSSGNKSANFIHFSFIQAFFFQFSPYHTAYSIHQEPKRDWSSTWSKMAAKGSKSCSVASLDQSGVALVLLQPAQTPLC
ncbi:ADP-ribosylation factor-related protein 1-like isoform X4 [Onychostruthus taczanowskii]|uniref:ADP-ribosylation factor-related protein 1-like isoform X4 n=1 Tax=Onychostruthus taczanowskii TaxID=356909 RepID=UPI001B80AEF5|nr:ADP-ribosylation factor-related protein 1-like isoform X4 [Onychostruthus taczanowskii]